MKPELSLLKKGPKFTSTILGERSNLKLDLYDFTRRLQVREIFNDSENNDQFLVYNKSNYQFKTNNEELSNIVKEIE